MNKDELKIFLERIKNEEISIDDGVEKIKKLEYDDLGYAKIDNHREIRNGYPEVIYCENKSNEHIKGIIENMLKTGNNILATRATRENYEYVKDIDSDIEYYEIPRLIVIKKKKINIIGGTVLIATGGTSDIKVAEEAAITLEIFGNKVERLYDVGVAGIHRLLSNKDKLNEANVIITVAGMEGALASVVGGLTDKPVIAVPTSVGYGASFNGLAALLAMLNSCASGVGVVNIDNGFGAGYLASTINRQIES
ncbi:MAG: nickel pincer cofactor biosynthesis protein LarB [Senegalia sp. (in: firmicutes)]|uniref:nickel pincer cofactor biosynthesis protein LarB n=1 Tax=Senegalia sp. (in: firmicutes) TaxID=1924098 RepID=UPI003F94B525